MMDHASRITGHRSNLFEIAVHEVIHIWTVDVDESEEWSSQFKQLENYFIYTSRHFTPHGRHEPNKLTWLPMCGFIAQLVEHRTGIAEVTGSNPVEALIFFRLLLSNCLNWKIYCDDHISLSSTTTVQIWIISYKIHMKKFRTKKTKTSSCRTESFPVKGILILVLGGRYRLLPFFWTQICFAATCFSYYSFLCFILLSLFFVLRVIRLSL